MTFRHWRHERAAAWLRAAVGGVALLATAAQAGTLQDTIFARVDTTSSPRLFYRLMYVNAHVRTTSKDAYDVTGPVLARGDFSRYMNPNIFDSSFQRMEEGELVSFDTYYQDASTLVSAIEGSYDRQANESGCEAIRKGLGTPCGVRVKGQATLGTAAVSLGYFLDDPMNWAVEALVLAAPLKVSVMGDGPNQMRGQKIIETKLLPPIVMLGRYFGAAGDGLRPYVGLGVSYAVFYDTRATQTLNAYQGGSSPLDTTVRIHNAWGLGPVVGGTYSSRDQGWQFGLSIGRLRYKTDTTLTTRNTRFTSESLPLKDFGAWTSSALVSADGTFGVNDPNKAVTVKTTGSPQGYTAGQAVHVTTAVMCDLARAKRQSTDCNLGTFERRASNTLDGTMFMLSIGHSF